MKTEVTWPALGFTADSGAVAKILASLNQYGLIERKTGEISITPLAIQILHPVSDEQKMVSLQKAALKSPVFVLIRKQFDSCDESVLSNQLVQLKFTPEGASRTAQIYKANVKFARLDLVDPNNLEIAPEKANDEKPIAKSKGPEKSPREHSKEAFLSSSEIDPFRIFMEKKKTLPVPLGSGDTIQVPYPMSEEDFLLLIQTLKLWKKRIVTPP